MSPAPKRWPHQLQIAAGSVAGSRHARAGRNNQDAFAWHRSDAGAALVVCDGCSSEPFSEIGARLGASILTASIASRLEEAAPLEYVIEAARRDLLASLSLLAEAMGGDRKERVFAHFLFTVVGAVVRFDETIVFGLGDGSAWVNGTELPLGTFEGNAPPYLGYALAPGAKDSSARFRIHAALPTRELRSLAIATDGASDLLGGVDGFFGEPFFRNRDMVRRRLTVLSRELTAGLPDDTTLIVLRAEESLGGAS